ncbi:unnamed protein product [marine sediment metagenome]|uniref:Uncharacterized protein n=1 Tax=marine sediment metagenome TaxID=412755 RepID=X0X0W9_9ZZZZ
MAEFLIYDKDHWMDKLNQAEYDKQMKHPHFAEKFLSRYQRGDIIEVRPDGFWTGSKAKGFNREVFRIISVPGLKPDKMYMEAIEAGTVTLKRRRFSISTGATQKATTVSSINDLSITDKNG